MAHFEADFADGTTYVQGADDTSIDTPGKNAFYDILQRAEEVIAFHVITNSGDVHTVDLRDGHFEINQVPFRVHDNKDLPLVGKLKLVYWKQIHQNFRHGDEEPYEIKINQYLLGWQDENGRSATIGVSGEA